ncbi:MAG: LuxR C-terminal-related transcriptional regulator [Gaiellaceae bacterium]
MELLSDRDVRGLLEFVHQASEVDGPDAFPEPVAEAFWQLIPSDAGVACVVFSALDSTVEPEARSVLAFSHVDCEWCVGVTAPWTDELDAACRTYVEREDPAPPVPAFMNHPVRQSDLISRRAFHRHGLWGDVCRVTGVQETLQLWLDVPGEPLLRRIGFSSGRPDGIDDRDVRVLELLVPHLIRLHRRAAERRTAPSIAGLTPRELEVIRLVARGKTNREIAHSLWISPHTVRTHLENMFEKLEVTNRTAAAARVFGPSSVPT